MKKVNGYTDVAFDAIIFKTSLAQTMIDMGTRS